VSLWQVVLRCGISIGAAAATVLIGLGASNVLSLGLNKLIERSAVKVAHQ
jgi:hypothetical protein